MIPRSRLILHAVTRIAVYLAAFALAAYLLADLIALVVDNAPHVGTLLIGWMLGVLSVALSIWHDRSRRSKSVAVIVQLPRSVLLERAPAGPVVPAKWRNSRGHVRYWLEGE